MQKSIMIGAYLFLSCIYLYAAQDHHNRPQRPRMQINHAGRKPADERSERRSEKHSKQRRGSSQVPEPRFGADVNDRRAALLRPQGCFSALTIRTLEKAMSPFSEILFHTLAEASLYQNLVIAGPSAHNALTLAYLGAGSRGVNRSELAKTLFFQDPPEDSQRATLADHLQRFIYTLAALNSVNFQITNSSTLFVRGGIKVRPDFTELIRNTGAQVVATDFTDPNFLVLQSIFSLTGLWAKRFSQTSNEVTVFTPIRGPLIPITLMSQTYFFRYYTDGDLQMLELPLLGPTYKDRSEVNHLRFSVYLVLPSSNALFDVTLNGSTHEWLDAHVRHMSMEWGNVLIPKFKIESDLDLVPSLKNLGVLAAFSKREGFTQITPEDAAVLSGVRQKVSLNFHEGGIGTLESLTSNSSSADSNNRSVVPIQVPTFTFKADHPFLVFIRDNQTGLVLLEGAIYQP